MMLTKEKLVRRSTDENNNGRGVAVTGGLVTSWSWHLI